MKKIDELINKIVQTKNPVCIGLDTMHEYLPEELINGNNSAEYAANAMLDFNIALIDTLADIIPCVKVQVAYYEMYGVYGMIAFQKTLEYAKKRGLLTIADVKRNDIGDTARAYAKAYIEGIDICNDTYFGFNADFITVNAYLGIDGILPFIKACEKTGAGIFVLVKTSNKSSGEFQDLQIGNEKLYEIVGQHVLSWGENLIGEHGYSSVGAVVGATYPGQAKDLRDKLKSVFFLIPGYGAQGASARDIVVNFDQNGLGGIINSSRGILLAYRQEKYSGMKFYEAAKAATLDMQKDILSEFENCGIKI